jgi:5-aminopentanamidase
MKVAAYQAPLAAINSFDVLELMREQIAVCEAQGVEILCCPEGVLGGLADYTDTPLDFALEVESGQLHKVLAPLASERIITILGFTETDRAGRLYNAAAVFHQDAVIGVYRKLYPAINHSVYTAGDQIPVFTVGELTFGILLCRDSTYYEPARIMAAQGAAALFVPTNNGLPPGRVGPEIVDEARNTDMARAMENSVAVIRADVVGQTESLLSYGSSGIVNHDGQVLQAARPLVPDLIIADIQTRVRAPRRGWDAAKNRAVMDAYIRLFTPS